MKKTSTTLLVAAVVLATGSAAARDNIRIVGSSTVFPFSSSVAEQFGNKTSYPTPIVEQNGTGGGAKDFCQGVGTEYPDITNASRRMKRSEFELCKANGVTEIIEIKIGFDGIVMANSKDGPALNLTLKQIFMALAKQVPIGGELVANPYRRWSEIDSSLPDARIEVFGPPPTSGTRDAFVEIAMEKGAKEFQLLQDLSSADKDAFKIAAHTLREDGPWVDGGENDNAIVQTLVQNSNTIGIFGFSFLDQNSAQLKGSAVDGVKPTFENIASSDYGVARTLYFYIKKQHIAVVLGIEDFVAEFVSDDAIGEFGYLSDKGLIPLTPDEQAQVRESVSGLEVWDGS